MYIEGRVIRVLIQCVVRLVSQQWLCVSIGFSHEAIRRALGSRVLSGTFRSEEGGRRKLNLLELRNLNFSSAVFRMINSRTVIPAGCVARIGEN